MALGLLRLLVWLLPILITTFSRAIPLQNDTNFTEAVAATVTHTLTIPPAQPTNAAIVPQNFVGFGFGQAWLNNYANDFSENLINSIATRMSVPPIIRIGGTVGDLLSFDPSQTEKKKCIGDGCPNSSHATFILGPSYFEDFKRFPNARMTFQAPLGKKLNVSNTLAYVTRAWEALGKERVDAIAIGNEVSVEDGTAKEYVNNTLELEEKIIDALNLTGSDRKIFEVVDTISRAAESHNPYAVKEVFQAGINDNGFVKHAAEHWYQVGGKHNPSTPGALQKNFINHTAITKPFEGYSESIDYVQKNAPNVSYVLSETGAAIGNSPLNFSDAFGATLWSVDFNFASMVRGVARISDSGRPAAGHSSWVPDNSSSNPGPSVRAPFAANALISEFVGKKEGVAVAEASVEDGGEDGTLSAYAAYKEGLKRVAIVNMRIWKKSDGNERASRVFEVPVGNDVQTVRIRKLSGENGAEAMGFDLGGKGDNVTWAGEQWSYEVDRGMGHFPSGNLEEESVGVENGTAEVKVSSSEAVIVFVD